MVDKTKPVDWTAITDDILYSDSMAGYFNKVMGNAFALKSGFRSPTENIWTASDASTPFLPRHDGRDVVISDAVLTTGVSGKTATSVLVDAIGVEHKKEFLVGKVREAQAVRRAALKSIEHVLAMYPSLRPRGAGCVTTAAILGPDVDDLLHEILHKVDFRRKDYGYGSHRRYSEGLRSLVRDWNTEFHKELLQDCDIFISRTSTKGEPGAPVIAEIDRGANWGTW